MPQANRLSVACRAAAATRERPSPMHAVLALALLIIAALSAPPALRALASIPAQNPPPAAPSLRERAAPPMVRPSGAATQALAAAFAPRSGRSAARVARA